MQDYKLQLQRANDIAMEDFRDKKNKEILSLKTSHNNLISQLQQQLNDTLFQKENSTARFNEANAQNQQLRAQIEDLSKTVHEKSQALSEVQEKLSLAEKENEIQTGQHRQEIDTIISDTNDRLNQLEATIKNNSASSAENYARLEGEYNTLVEAKRMADEHASEIRVALDHEHRAKVELEAEVSAKLLNAENRNAENIQNEQKKYFELDLRLKNEIKSRDEKISLLQVKLASCEELQSSLNHKIHQLQEELNETLEQADEKIQFLEKQKADELAKLKVEGENAIIDITNRYSMEKKRELQQQRELHDEKIRAMQLEHEKELDLEKQRSKIEAEQIVKLRDEIDRMVKQHWYPF